MKLRRRVPDYTTPDCVHSLQEGAGPRFGEKSLKTTENLGCSIFHQYQQNEQSRLTLTHEKNHNVENTTQKNLKI
jgi:hypothetical protein